MKCKATKSNEKLLLRLDNVSLSVLRMERSNRICLFTSSPTFRVLLFMERLTKAKGELMLASSYDYIVVNDEIENAVDKIIAIIRAEHAKCERALERYYELMEE